MTLSISVEPHPKLALGAFVTELSAPLGELGFDVFAEAPPIARSEAIRAAVRDVLRHGGYKPTGRGKPASEYLVQAAERGTLAPINLAVDACNHVSLHSGLPISVVDGDRCRPPLRVGVAGEASYVFNNAGQVIALAGLLCLFDADGPCANAIKDSQRTKTDAGTRRTLSLVWAPSAHRERLVEALAWYRRLLEKAGARTEDVALEDAAR